MVPEKVDDIPAATRRAIDRLLDRMARDRESMSLCGYAADSPEMARLNRLAEAADELKRDLLSSEAGESSQTSDMNSTSDTSDTSGASE